MRRVTPASFEEKILLRTFSSRRELQLTWLGIAVTVFASLMVGADLATLIRSDIATGSVGELLVHLLLSLFLVALIYGGLVYQFARLRYIERLRDHEPATESELEEVFSDKARPLAILVPAYKEEVSVVKMTLMSAALQDYPNRRIALLLDDPPAPKSAADAQQLAEMRQLPNELEAKFARPKTDMWKARSAFLTRSASGPLDLASEYHLLGDLNEIAADWMRQQIADFDASEPAGRLFIDKVLHNRHGDLLSRAHRLRGVADAPGVASHGLLSRSQCEHEYDRLISLFDVGFVSFERKRYENLSHEANKAMNLNSYLGLMGKQFREVSVGDKLHLEEVDEGFADLMVPYAEYVITLDADSLLLPDYALRLTHFMEQPGRERLAVVQTPYSAFPGVSGALERIAGATTDIQYIIHQGFTGYDATYWVGANALLRRSALDDIVELDTERGFTIRRYIQDRTVIEDTESTIDLVNKGWRLHNYPERLAYSATPPDFGSLLIQRRRWANGGLIILPKLLQRVFGRSADKATFGEAFMRIHYLVSIAAVNFGLLFLLAFPITNDVENLWLPLTAVAYFSLYTRDLIQLGYRGTDLLRVYALNLLLIPVNLGGVLKSIQQGISKAKIPFGRTPKVTGRTAAPVLYIMAEYLLLTSWLVGAGFDIASDRWAHGVFAMVNALFLGYAIVRFIGIAESIEDISRQLPSRRVSTVPADQSGTSHALPSTSNVASST